MRDYPQSIRHVLTRKLEPENVALYNRQLFALQNMCINEQYCDAEALTGNLKESVLKASDGNRIMTQTTMSI